MKRTLIAILTLSTVAGASWLRREDRPEYAYYGAEWIGHALPKEVPAGGSVSGPVMVRNTGTCWWGRDSSVKIAYSIFDESGKRLVAFGSGVFPIESTVAPGQVLTTWPTVTAPKEPGNYRYRFDMLLERVNWFEERGGKPLIVPVVVNQPALE